MIRSITVTVCIAAALPLWGGLNRGAAVTVEVQLATQSGYRAGQAKIELISRPGAADAAVLLSVFDPRTTQYWWAVFRDPAPPMFTTARFQRDVLEHMTFAAEPSRMVGFFTVLSQLRIRPVAMRAVSLESGHAYIRATAVELALASERTSRTAWSTVPVPNAFVICGSDPAKAPPPQTRPDVMDTRHENRRWYVTLKNFCGKRRVLTLSESFELLD